MYLANSRQYCRKAFVLKAKSENKKKVIGSIPEMYTFYIHVLFNNKSTKHPIQEIDSNDFYSPVTV